MSGAVATKDPRQRGALRRARSVSAAVVALAAVAAGCTGDPGDGPSPTPSTAPSSPSPSSTASDPGGGETSTAPEPTPADGPLVEADAYAFRVPRGYRVDGDVSFSVNADDPETLSSIHLGALSGAPDQSLDDLVRRSRQIVLWSGRPRRLPDVVIDGVAFYHLVGRQDPVAGVEEFGTVHDGSDVRLSFALRLPPAQRRDVIDSVLATFTWR